LSYGIRNQILFPLGELLYYRHVQLVISDRNPEFDGFSIGYVHVTSEPTDSQVLSSNPVGTTLLLLCPVRHL